MRKLNFALAKLFHQPFFKKVEGQMSSPFELMVAVIIMTFVIIIGTQMLNQSQDQVCLASIDRELTEFKINLEDTTNSRSATKFDFRPDNCYNQNEAVVKIFRYADSATCGAKCGISGVNSCYVLLFSTNDIANGFKEKCINIPTYATFLGSDSQCSPGPDLEGFSPILAVGEDGENLTPGTYALRNVSSASEAYPSVCIFRRA
jgi:hypothetical protein